MIVCLLFDKFVDFFFPCLFVFNLFSLGAGFCRTPQLGPTSSARTASSLILTRKHCISSGNSHVYCYCQCLILLVYVGVALDSFQRTLHVLRLLSACYCCYFYCHCLLLLLLSSILSRRQTIFAGCNFCLITFVIMKRQRLIMYLICRSSGQYTEVEVAEFAKISAQLPEQQRG